MSLNKLVFELTAQVAGLQQGMNQAIGLLQDVKKEADSANASWEKFGSSLETIGGKMMAFGAGLTAGITAPILGIGAAAVKMSEDLLAANTSFTTMLGSAEKAGAFLDELKQFAATTPFEFPDLVSASQKMMAFGFSAKEVVPLLKAVGDAAASKGGAGKDAIDGMTLALGKMQAKAKVSAEEMNMLMERGVPAWEILSKAMGKSVQEVMKIVSTQGIESKGAIDALMQGMNEKFGGQMEKLSKTLTGVWSNFKDTATMALADLGKTLTPVLKDLLENYAVPLLNWAKDLAAKFAALDPHTQKLVLGLVAAAAAIGPLVAGAGLLVAAIGSMVTGWAAISGAVATASAAFGTVAAALSPVGIAVAAVAAAFAAWKLAEWADQNVTWFHDALVPVKAALDNVANAIVPVWNKLKELGEVIAAIGLAMFTQTVEWLSAKLQPLVQWITRVGASFATWALDKIAGMLKAFGDDIQWVIDKIKAIPGVSSALDAFRKKFSDISQDAKTSKENIKAANDEIGKTGEAVTKAGDAAGKAAPKIKVLVDENKAAEKAARDSKKSHDELEAAMNKFGMSLDGPTKRVGELKEALKKLEEAKNAGLISPEQYQAAYTQLIKAMEDAKKAADPLVVALKDIGIEVKKPVPDLQTLETRVGLLDQALTRGLISPQDYARHMKDLREQIELAKNPLEAVRPLFEQLNAELSKQVPSLQALATAYPNATQGVIDLGNASSAAALQQAQSTVQLVEAEKAAAKLGITLEESTNKHLEEMLDAYIALAQNTKSTTVDMEKAWLAYEKARIEAAVAAGQQITESDRETLKRAREFTNQGLNDQVKEWDKFGKQVSTIITDLGKDIANVILEGGNMVDTFEKAAKAIGKAFLRWILEDAIGQIRKGFAGMHLDFNNIFNAIGKAAESLVGKLKTLFGGLGGGGGGDLGGLKPPTGGGGGGAGGVLGSIGGIGGVAGIVDAIFGGLQYFQGRRMEKDIGRIEVTTRGQLNEALNLRDDLWSQHWDIMTKLDDMLRDLKVAISQVTVAIRDGQPDHPPPVLEDIKATQIEELQAARAMVAQLVALGLASANQVDLMDQAIKKLQGVETTTGETTKAVSDADKAAQKAATEQGKQIFDTTQAVNAASQAAQGMGYTGFNQVTEAVGSGASQTVSATDNATAAIQQANSTAGMTLDQQKRFNTAMLELQEKVFGHSLSWQEEQRMAIEHNAQYFEYLAELQKISTNITGGPVYSLLDSIAGASGDAAASAAAAIPRLTDIGAGISVVSGQIGSLTGVIANIVPTTPGAAAPQFQMPSFTIPGPSSVIGGSDRGGGVTPVVSTGPATIRPTGSDRAGVINIPPLQINPPSSGIVTQTNSMADLQLAATLAAQRAATITPIYTPPANQRLVPGTNFTEEQLVEMDRANRRNRGLADTQALTNSLGATTNGDAMQRAIDAARRLAIPTSGTVQLGSGVTATPTSGAQIGTIQINVTPQSADGYRLGQQIGQGIMSLGFGQL